MSAWLIDRLPNVALSIGANMLGLKFRLKRYSVTMRNILAEWQALESLPLAEIEARQLTQMRHILKRAATAPFYAERFRSFGFNPDHFSSLEELKQLPVLTRQDIRDHAEYMLVPDVGGPVITRKSSGTTGEPITFKQPRKLVFDYAYAALYQSYAWHGIAPLSRRATLAGRYLGNHPKGVVLRNYFENQLLLGVHSLRSGLANRYIEALRRFKPQILQAHPSAMLMLMNCAQEQGLEPVETPVIAFTGETLLENERLRLADWFKADIFGQYGSGEHHIAAAECSYLAGYHINPFFSHTEIVQSVFGGLIVSTSLLNDAMPLIRYQIGDMAERIETAPCACGRSWPRLVGLRGRVDDALTTFTGCIVAPVIIRTGLAAQFSKLPPYSIVQHKEPGRYTLQLFTDQSAESFAPVAVYLENLLKPNARVEVATILPSNQFTLGGKRKMVIRE